MPRNTKTWVAVFAVLVLMCWFWGANFINDAIELDATSAGGGLHHTARAEGVSAAGRDDVVYAVSPPPPARIETVIDKPVNAGGPPGDRVSTTTMITATTTTSVAETAAPEPTLLGTAAAATATPPVGTASETVGPTTIVASDTPSPTASPAAPCSHLEPTAPEFDSVFGERLPTARSAPGTTAFLGNGVPGPHRYTVGRLAPALARSRPSLDPPLRLTDVCRYFNASIELCEAASNITTDVDTVCVLDLDGRLLGSGPQLERLASLDPNVVFSVFAVPPAWDQPTVAAEVVHSPRLRVVTARNAFTMAAAIDELSVFQAGHAHCRLTVALLSNNVSEGDAVVEALSPMFSFSHATLLDLTPPSAADLASHLTHGAAVVGTGGRVRDVSRSLLGHLNNVGMAMGIKDLLEGDWRRMNVSRLRAFANTTDGNRTTTRGVRDDLVSQLMGYLGEIGNISTICVATSTRLAHSPLFWLLRHPTASFRVLVGDRHSCKGDDGAADVFAEGWCGAKSNARNRPLRASQRMLSSAPQLPAERGCELTVVDGVDDWQSVLQHSDAEFNTVIVVGARQVRAATPAVFRTLVRYGGPLRVLIGQAPSAHRSRTDGAVLAGSPRPSITTTSAEFETAAAAVACAPLDRDVLAGGPAFEGERDWHDNVMWHDLHNIQALKTEMLHLENTSATVREYYTDVSWARNTQKHVEIASAISWRTNPIPWGQLTLAMDLSTRQIVDIASGVLTSGRYWGSGDHVNQLGDQMRDMPRQLLEPPQFVVPASPSGRYYWAGGMCSQGYHSHGLEELLNHFGRYWAICRGDDTCVRGTPMVMPNLTTVAFKASIAFFDAVLPEVPLIFFPVESVVSSPNGSSMIFALPEMTPAQMPARAAFVSRILWPRVQQYVHRVLPSIAQRRPTRVVVMKVPRSSSGSPGRSFIITPAFRERLERLGFVWIEDDAPKEVRAWYVGHALTVVTTWGATHAISQELFPGEWRAGRWLRMVILQHSSYDHEVWQTDAERAKLDANLTRIIYTDVRVHNVREKVIRLPHNNLDLLPEDDLTEVF